MSHKHKKTQVEKGKKRGSLAHRSDVSYYRDVLSPETRKVLEDREKRQREQGR